MDLEQLQMALRAAIRDEGVAKKEDLHELKEKMEVHDKRLDGLEAKILALEAQAGSEQEKEIRRGRPSVASSTATASSSASRRDKWAPRLVLVRGFAPFVATAAEKVRQKEVPSLQETILSMCDSGKRAALVPCSGYALNRNIAFKCVEGRDTRSVADALDKALQANKFRTKG